MVEYDSVWKLFENCMHCAFQTEWGKWFCTNLCCEFWKLWIVNNLSGLEPVHKRASFTISLFSRWFVSSFGTFVWLCYGLTIRSTNKQNAIMLWFFFLRVFFSVLVWFCISFFLAISGWNVFYFGAESAWICVKCDTMSFLRNTLIKCDVCVGREIHSKMHYIVCAIKRCLRTLFFFFLLFSSSFFAVTLHCALVFFSPNIFFGWRGTAQKTTLCIQVEFVHLEYFENDQNRNRA